jgi:hypothetical protein
MKNYRTSLITITFSTPLSSLFKFKHTEKERGERGTCSVYFISPMLGSIAVASNSRPIVTLAGLPPSLNTVSLYY